MRRMERKVDIGAVGDEPGTAATAGDTDIADSNSVDRDSSYEIVGDTPATNEQSVGMGMDIVDSTCTGTDCGAPATKDTSRDMNVADDCMHVCVNENAYVCVHVGSRTTRVAGEALTSAEVWGKLI